MNKPFYYKYFVTYLYKLLLIGDEASLLEVLGMNNDLALRVNRLELHICLYMLLITTDLNFLLTNIVKSHLD